MNFIPNQIDPLSLPFVSFADRNLLPKVTGIYFLLSQIGEVLYIGQAENIHQRWIGHHRTPNINSRHALRIAWVEIEKQLLNQVESAWIRLYCPPLNGSVPIARKAFVASIDRPNPTALRERVGLTQREVADALNKRVQTLSDWERGVTRPRLSFAETYQLMRLYKCSLIDLAKAFDRVDPDTL